MKHYSMEAIKYYVKQTVTPDTSCSFIKAAYMAMLILLQEFDSAAFNRLVTK